MTAILLPYLGTPGSMQALPSPNGDLIADPNRGEVAHTLLSGAVAVQRLLHARRTFTLPYVSLLPADADLIMGFYLGLYGDGPFVFVDPSQRNVLGLDVSSCGVRSNASPGWVASAGSLSTAAGSPVSGSGVLTWTSLTASATLQPGTTANVATSTKAPVYLPGEAATTSLWVKASSSATMSLQLTGYDAMGAVLVTSLATSVAATTTWQKFSVSAAVGASAFAAAAFVLPRLVLGGTVPTSVSIAAAQLEYASTATAWQPGAGAPRVLMPSTPGRTVSMIGWSTHNLVLSEAL